MDLTVIIPCYNEEDNIPALYKDLMPVMESLATSRSVELIFVDDGSADNTWELLWKAFMDDGNESFEIHFQRHLENRGLGAAIRTGFDIARGDLILTTDSDGTYNFDTFPIILDYLAPEYDIVTASPYHPDGEVVGVPAFRLLLSRGSSLIYRFIVQWNIHTYTCLYRVYRREVIEEISFSSDGYLAGTELMVKAMLRGYQVREYPARLYTRMFGASKAKILRTITAHLKFQLQVLLHRLYLKSLVPRNRKPSREAIR